MKPTRSCNRQSTKAAFVSKACRVTSAAALALLVCAPTLQAHPGHSLGDANAQHLLTSPDHLAVLALGGLGLWFAARFVQRRLPRQVLRGLGLAAMVTAAVLWGIRS